MPSCICSVEETVNNHTDFTLLIREEAVELMSESTLVDTESEPCLFYWGQWRHSWTRLPLSVRLNFKQL